MTTLLIACYGAGMGTLSLVLRLDTIRIKRKTAREDAAYAGIKSQVEQGMELGIY